MFFWPGGRAQIGACNSNGRGVVAMADLAGSPPHILDFIFCPSILTNRVLIFQHPLQSMRLGRCRRRPALNSIMCARVHHVRPRVGAGRPWGFWAHMTTTRFRNPEADLVSNDAGLLQCMSRLPGTERRFPKEVCFANSRVRAGPSRSSSWS